MIISSLNCCAVSEVYGLVDDPRETMQSFCKLVTPKYGRYINPRLGAFYIFTDVVKYKGTCTQSPCRGKAFAKFIKDNRLGQITESHERLNRLGAPRHLDKVWVWSPSKRNVLKWWKSNKDK